MPNPYDYVVPQANVGTYFDAMRQGREDRLAVENEQKQNALSKYLPQALNGDEQARTQAMSFGTPDQQIALKQRFMELDEQKLATLRRNQSEVAAMAVNATDPTSWAAVNARAKQLDPTAQEIPFEQRAMVIAKAQTVAEALKAAHDEKLLANDTSRTQAQNAASYASAANSRASAARGGKAPTGYTWSQDGMSLVPIPGGPADPATKPMNEGQANAAGFANRIRSANEILNGKDAGAALGDSVTQGMAAIPLAGNYLAGQDYQQADQAVRDFINAQLRRESGAAIGSSEFENAYKQYIPRPGDGPKVLAQKKAARELALQNMLLASGSGGMRQPPATPPQAPPAPQGARPMQNGAPIVRSQAEFDALPSGSVYVEPDGKKYRKP